MQLLGASHPKFDKDKSGRGRHQLDIEIDPSVTAGGPGVTSPILKSMRLAALISGDSSVSDNADSVGELRMMSQKN